MAGRYTDNSQLAPTTIDSLLDDKRRRYLLYCLHMYTNPLRLPDIAHQVTVWEQPESDSVGLQQRLKTYMSLYHDQIPKLSSSNVVCYEQGEDMVELGPAAERIEPTLESRLRADIDKLLHAEEATTP